MIKKELNKCTGCYACYNACLQDCISMELDEEGFRFPIVDSGCIQCKKCIQVCTIGKSFTDGRVYHPRAYACYVDNDDIRKQSATSGISFYLGKQVIESGGIVYGAVGNMASKVYHAAAQTVDDLELQRKSKYLQSEIRDNFRIAKAELEQGKQVLFTGTACQIAGLYSYLGREYKNLYTLDLICHGVPSKAAFEKYVEELEIKYNSKLISMSRDKKYGWKPPHYTLLFENGEALSMATKDNPFTWGFATNIFIRRSCYTCPYAKIPRTADITVGDYFDGDKQKLHDPENKGLSLLTTNTQKGESLFLSALNGVKYWEYPIETAIKEGNQLAHPPEVNIYRKTFFYLLRKRKYSQIEKILRPKNFFHRQLRRGYGVFCYMYEWLRGGFPS